MRSAWVGFAVLVAACSRPLAPTVATLPTPVVVQRAPEPEQLFAPSTPAPAFADPNRRAKLVAAFPELEKALEQERAEQNVIGMVVGVVIDGELAYEQGFGVVDHASKIVPDADTVYRLGAITKTFTGLALLALRDDGAIALDDPLTRWVSEARRLIYPTRDERPITLRQLAQQTSGLERDRGFDLHKGPDEATVVGALASLTLDRAPGVYSPSNFGFALLGIAMSHAAKQPLRALIASRLLKPLGMTSTGWEPTDVPARHIAPALASGDDSSPVTPDRVGALDGSMGMFSSVRDLARYAAFLLAAYPPRDDAEHGPIARASVREAQRSGAPYVAYVVPVPDPKPGAPSVELAAGTNGFGWNYHETCKAIDRVEAIGAEDGEHTGLALRTGSGVAVIVLSNAINANISRFLDRAFDVLDATGAMKERDSSGAEPAEYVATMTAFLDAYNNDVTKLGSVLSRPVHPTEPDELAYYKSFHGTCTTFALANTFAPRKLDFALSCERGGPLDIVATFDASGKLTGFIGHSPELAVPDQVRKLFAAALTLVFEPKWDAAAYKFLTPDQHLAPDGLKQFAARSRAQFGVCVPGTITQEGFGWAIALTCSNGPPMKLTITFDRNGRVNRLNFVQQDGTDAQRCPIR
jgi:CubicO group peptidase (beta-lactamase class C family)